VVRAFEQAWSSEGFFSREHEERRLAEGRETLRRFVERETASGRTPLAVEMEFKFRSGSDWVRGRWDRIDEREGGIVLVDYKTSDVEDRDGAQQRARESLRNEQLGIYALAYHETRGTLPAKVELHFVGQDLVGAADVGFEHLDRARERIAAAAVGIRGGLFPARPDARNCSFCDYSRFCPHSAARGG
jgi:DNA helicase-2/ATP-dependent DNA helicase PcrA